MANRLPSFLALLGLAAAAGYQNRDALRQMMGSAPPGGQTPPPYPGTAQAPAEQPGWLETIVDRARNSLGGGGGSPMGAGLGELVDRFTRSGSGEAANSWVGTGQNRTITPEAVRAAVGPDVVGELVRQTGLSEATLLSRLAQSLPELVDQETPDGRLPHDPAASRDQSGRGA